MAKEDPIIAQLNGLNSEMIDDLLEMLNEYEPYQRNEDNLNLVEPIDEKRAREKEFGSAILSILPQPFFYTTIKKWQNKHKIKGNIKL